MKLKLIQEGYEGFTGLLGVTLFEDGVSVNDVPGREARTIGMSIKAEWEDGTDPNPAQGLLDSMHNEPVMETAAAPVVPTVYTEEQLAEIADKEGIKGLRAIAEPLGIKGTSIKELMAEILAYKPE